ncbi:MAG: hypothetical protein AB1589_07925 [Cyanobacteriota bacterium]
MSKHRNDLLKVSSNRQRPKLTLWHNLSEDEQATISGGISPMLPLDLIRAHRNTSLSPGELDRI